MDIIACVVSLELKRNWYPTAFFSGSHRSPTGGCCRLLYKLFGFSNSQTSPSQILLHTPHHSRLSNSWSGFKYSRMVQNMRPASAGKRSRLLMSLLNVCTTLCLIICSRSRRWKVSIISWSMFLSQFSCIFLRDELVLSSIHWQRWRRILSWWTV